MLSKHLSEILNELEGKLPVYNWKYKNIHLWPVLKTGFLPKNVVPIKNKIPFFVRILLNSGVIMSSLLSIARILLIKPKMMFLNFDEHMFRMNGISVNKYFEGFKKDLKPFHKGADFNFVHSYRKENFSLKTFFNTVHVPMLIKLFSSRSTFKNDLLELNGYDSLKNYFEEKPIANFEGQLSEEEIKNLCIIIDQHLSFWKCVFKYYRPKLVFTCCYYIPQNFAMICAARLYNVPVIEIQHGNQKDYPPYIFFNVPRDGLNTLPNYFATWDTDSYDQIKSWSKDLPSVQPILTGNPWQSIWQSERWILDKYPDFHAIKIKNQNPVILYTLLPEADVLTEQLRLVILQTQDSYDWYIRLHPRQMNDIDRIDSELMSQGITRANLKYASELPLPLLLYQCDLHITSWSSVVIEASQYGKPSIVISEEGQNRYGHLKNVTGGLFDNSELRTAIEDSLSKSDLDTESIEFDTSTIRNIIKKIVA